MWSNHLSLLVVKTNILSLLRPNGFVDQRAKGANSSNHIYRVSFIDTYSCNEQIGMVFGYNHTNRFLLLIIRNVAKHRSQ